ncbi:MAG: coiled-coil domain-containing protein [Betaproteobacteria bacterium]
MAVEHWAPSRRVRRGVLLTILVTIVALIGSALPANADPDGTGQTKALSDQLEAAAKNYYEVKAKLTASQARQVTIKKQLADAQLSLTRLQAVVGQIAAARFEGGTASMLNSLLLASESPSDLLQAGAVAEYLIWRDDSQLHQLTTVQQTAASAQQQLDAEIANEKQQYAALDAAKRKAEKALSAVGGLVSAGFSAPSRDAQPAPRNADGSFPPERCSVQDPTTSGCITPRLFHALTEARLAGFTHYVACFRQATFGEHPLGRACDFAAAPNGFGGIAVGADRTYGNNLAAYFIHNSDALGVLYVIWFRQIWMPGIGWRSYDGCCDPASTHQNHVHLSVL